MEQAAYPAVGHGGHHHTFGFSSAQELLGEAAPMGVISNHAVSGLHQRGPQLPVAGLDQAGIGLSRAAGGVAGTEPAESGELLAGAKAIKSTDFRANGPGCHRADAFAFEQGLDQRILGGDLAQVGLGLGDVLL